MFSKSGFIWRNLPLFVAGALAIGLIALGTQGIGPLRVVDVIRDLGGDETASPAPSSTSSTVPGETTTTTFVLTRVDYDPGTCITWDQSPDRLAQRSSQPVPCEGPHLFEVTTEFEIDGSPYGPDGPNDDEWDTVSDTECAARATEHLGYPIDLHGRFYPTLLTPTTQGWRTGDRVVRCGIASGTINLPRLPDRFQEFTGAARGANQADIADTGLCFGTDVEGVLLVSCDEPHVFEVVGPAEVDDAAAPFPGPEAIDTLTDDRCLALAEQVYGAPLTGDLGFGSMTIEESSWNIGQRTVACTLGRIEADGTWIPTAGLVRA